MGCSVHHWLLPLLVAPMVAVACVGGSSSTATTQQPPKASTSGGGKIAFMSARDGNHEIYLMNPDGSGVTRLTNNPKYDDMPAWSREGKRIAFTSNRDGSTYIYVMNADGSGIIRVTNIAPCSFPSWSPDGKRIVFATDYDDKKTGEIYVVNADGSGLARSTNDQANDLAPTWSPTAGRSPSYLPATATMRST